MLEYVFGIEMPILTQVSENSPENHGYLEGFTTSFLAILVSQIGDKTFFLAMIMAMKYYKFIVFLGAYGALAIMTILSAAFGELFTTLISPTITNILATVLFFYFGAKMIYESTQHDDSGENDELKEVQIELKEMEDKYYESHSQKEEPLIENKTEKQRTKAAIPSTFILIKGFSMTFLAEWGDRSQIATIALAASFNVFMVTLGALLGHFICTAAACQIGSWISDRVQEKHVLLVGGIVFILSGIATLLLVI